MTKTPSMKLLPAEVYVLIIIPQVTRIRTHWHFNEWEVVVVCRPRTGMRIFVLIIPQVIRIHFGEWKVVEVVRRPRTRSLRGVKLFKKYSIRLWFSKMISNLWQGQYFGLQARSVSLESWGRVDPAQAVEA